MKNHLALRMVVLLLLLTPLSIQSKPSASGLLPTSLKITVINSLGNVVAGVSVTLYGSKEDYRAGKNPIQETQYTDQKGRVAFKKLQPRPYYLHAIKGDLSNNGEGVLTEKLNEGKVNKVNTVIQ